MSRPWLLTTLPDPERVRYARYRVAGDGRLRRRSIPLRVLKRAFRSLLAERQHAEFALIVAGLTVVAGETAQRQLVRRVVAPGVRGLTVAPGKPREFLFDLISPKAKGKEKATAKEKAKEKKRMMERLQAMIDQALAQFKEQAGLPRESPQAVCYTITDAVIEAAHSAACREYLEMNVRSCPQILSRDLEPFFEILGTRFPDEVSAVSEALQASRSRDHLAAISLTGEGENLNVTLVNTAGCRLTVRSRRFVQMMVNPGHPVLLGEFPDPRRYREPEVVYNNERKGVVYGQFSANHGCLEVICVDPDKTGATALFDRSSIAIDVDYALCLSLILDRLHRDEERVSRLMQELSTQAVDDKHRRLFTLN